MSTPTRTPRKVGAPRRDRQRQGVIVAPEKFDDPKAERVLWDLASQVEGLGGLGSVGGDWLKNPLKWPEGFVIEIDKWRTTAPIRWKVYEKSKRTRGKGIEFWLNDEKIIDAENNITASMVDHGGLGGLTDDDHTQYARTDGSRAITGTQVFNEDIKLKPTKRIYFDDMDLTSFMAEVSDGVIRISTASTVVADFDSTGLQLQQNLKFLSGTSFSLTLDHAATANRIATFPDATGTLPLLSLAQTFTAKQDIIPASGIALQVGTTNTAGDTVFGELTGATGYNGIGLQGSLTFGTGDLAQANFYSSTTDAILYINNRLNSNISFRINNVDAMIISGGNRRIGIGGAPGAYGLSLYESQYYSKDSTNSVETIMGSHPTDAYGEVGTLTNHPMRIMTNQSLRFEITAAGLLRNSVAQTILDQSGNLYQGGSQITATAAELNIMAGVTLTTAQINKAAIKDEANTFTAIQAITPAAVGDVLSLTNNNATGFGARITTASSSSVLRLETTHLTEGAHILMIARAGDPTSFANGMVWFDGTNLKIRKGGVTRIFAERESAQTFSGLNTFSLYLELQGDASLAPTKRLYFDGPGVLGNTYATQSAADVLTLVAGGKTTDLDFGLGKIDTQLGFRFQDGQASLGGILALDTITTGDKTYTFPDATGNVSLQGVSTWTFVSENTSIDTTSAAYVEVAIASTAWPGASFQKLREAYFEAVIGEATTGVARCQLYNATSATEITVVSTESVGPARVRSANIASSLTDNFDIQVRIKNDTAGQVAALWAARLILIW